MTELLFFFFFQAEDGIRDKLVTGVQTCALPISFGRTIGGLRLASAMVRPNVVDLLDAMLRAPGATRVEEVTVGRAAAGQTLGALKLQERTAVIVFALREAATQRHVFNPPPERVLQAGDVLMGCADPEQVAALQRIVTEG